MFRSAFTSSLFYTSWQVLLVNKQLRSLLNYLRHLIVFLIRTFKIYLFCIVSFEKNATFSVCTIIMKVKMGRQQMGSIEPHQHLRKFIGSIRRRCFHLSLACQILKPTFWHSYRLNGLCSWLFPVIRSTIHFKTELCTAISITTNYNV